LIIERKKAEDEYKTILQTTMDGFYLVDLKGKILEVNESYSSLIGYSREELLKMSIKDVEALETEKDIIKHIQKIKETGLSRFETKHRHKNGRIIDIEASLQFLKTDQEKLCVFMRDITDRKRAENVLKITQQGLIRAQAIAHIGSWNWDIKKNLVECSEEMCRIYGIDPKNSGVTIEDLVQLTHPDDLPRNIRAIESFTAGRRFKPFECRILHPDGMQRVVRVEGSEVERDPDGKPRSMFGIVQDITERKLLESKLVTMARTDVLTQLPNRACFLEKVEQELLRARRTGRQCAIMFVDLDNFKTINDTLGHTLGDELIKDSAVRIALCIRETDIMARFGGDEFIVFLNDLDGGEGAQFTAERIREKFNVSRQIMGEEIFITASIGIAIYPYDGDMLNDLLKDADTAMYAAKESGKNKFSFFNSQMNKSAVIKMQIEKDLRSALGKNEFVLYYQPIIHVAGGKVRGFEALLRWVRSEGGLVFPDEFIPIAEKTGLIIPIGEWVLHEACRFNKELVDLGYPDLVVSVNISVAQLRHGNMLGVIKKALDQNGLRPQLLEIEVTESLLIENFDSIIETLEAIKALGVQVSLDDFGTGYSSLAYLQKLPIMTLKIDRCFIKEIAKDSDESSMISTIIDLAHMLGLDVIAEGVETEGQLNKLSADLCDYYQGYFLSKPIKTEGVPSFLEDVKNKNEIGFAGGLKNPELLKDDRVKEEIERHRWIESEKCGYDIGYEKASADWLDRYSDMWIQFNHPKRRPRTIKKAKHSIVI